MTEERKDRLTTREEEEKLARAKEKGNPRDEVKEDVPPDSPPSQRGKDEAERKDDVQKQKDEKRQLHNEPE